MRGNSRENVSIARLGALAVVAALSLWVSACGDDDTSTASDGGTTEETTDGAIEVAQNACPAEGCMIDFASVEQSGDELEVTWTLNFDPDINNNHIHIYWDTYTADQVSNDATDRGVEQGEWVPTDEMPSYVTDGAVSTAVRGDSTTLCVVAGDRDHNVIDAGTQVCRDVSDLL